VRTTTLFTDPDARSQHALSSPFAVNLGDPSAYLDGDRIIQIAKDQGCQGIHPGYGVVRSPQPPTATQLTGTPVEREPSLCAEMHRGWPDLYRPSVAGN
jgi:3-methylcrotonyl-CoA carboxylase alpha subunit